MTDTASLSIARPAAASAQIRPTRSPWWGVVALSVVLFALVTSEFLPSSLLSRIASGVGVSEGIAGQTVTATAIMGAIVGPTISVLIPRLDRRVLMIVLALLALVSNVLVAIAPAFWMLLLARLLLGAAVAGFWALSLSISARLVPAERLGRAMMIVNVGVSVATVAAVPLGAYLGELWGWRAVFLLAAVACAAAAVLLRLWLPPVPAAAGTGLGALLGTLRTRIVLLGLGALALIAAGHFMGFTYIRPASERIEGLTPQLLATLLAVYGVAGFAGNLISGSLADRRLRLATLLVPVVVGVAMLGFGIFGTSLPAAIVTVGLWGLAFGAVPTTVQTWMARVAPDRLESVGGLTVAVFQLSIALGAVVGGILLDGVGVAPVLIVGGAAAVIGGVALFSVRPRE